MVVIFGGRAQHNATLRYERYERYERYKTLYERYKRFERHERHTNGVAALALRRPFILD